MKTENPRDTFAKATYASFEERTVYFARITYIALRGNDTTLKVNSTGV